MRTLFCGIVVAAVAFLAAPHAQQAPAPSFTGRVATAGSGTEVRPVRRARVTLTGGGLTAPRVADTDTKGEYRFNGLGPGDYKVTVQKPGFVKLDAVSASPGATLTMIRGGAIEGVVADAAGDPVWNIVVTALQPQPDDGKPKTIAETKTDDRGRYRLHSLPAGDYVVQAATDRAFVTRLFLVPGEKPPGINAAFYPAASSMTDAKTLRVPQGQDVSSIDITFTPAAPIKDPAAPPPAPRPDLTGNGHIAGVVSDATTGKPLKDAQILLLPAAGQGQRLTNWKRTDAQGRYEYGGLTAQRYTIQFRAPRHVALSYGQKRPRETGTEIQLGDAEDYRADMQLPQSSAIEGTLLDEFGDPAPGISAQIAQRVYAGGRQRVVSAMMPVLPTDDRGRYRISAVEPGEYFVIALSGVYAEGEQVGGFAPTYYPGTSDSSAATPISVAFGADTTGLTFPLIAARTFTVSGTMLDAEGKPVAGRGTLWLNIPDHLRKPDFHTVRAPTGQDGSFVLRNVPQGMYTLQGFAPPPQGYRGPGNLAALPFGYLPLTVGDADLDGVVLKTTAGTSLRGRFVVEDSNAPRPDAERLHVTALPVEFDSAPMAGGPPPTEVHEDLTFEVTRMSGLRRILASTQTPEFAVKRITLNGRDITDATVDLREKDVEGIEVVLTTKVSRVTGAVSDDKGPVSDYAVVIFPSDPTKWIDRSRYLAIARPTQQGRFTVNALPPEDYLAIALPNIVGSEYMNPEFLQQLRINATAFSLQGGESKTLDLKLKKRP